MSAIPHIGKCFPTKEGFLGYLDGLQFGAWRPQYVVVHHCGSPNLKTWNGWQTRAKPVTDTQWLENLAVYYGSAPPIGPGDGPWQHGPHFMFTPANYGVLSLPTVRGTHAKSFNANSWCVEMVGDFDVEDFNSVVDRYADGIAALHIAAGLQPAPYARQVRGIHFHRDDPLTSKTCPGNKVDKARLVAAVQAKMDAMNGHEHPVAKTEPTATPPVTRQGTVVNVKANDTLNVRAGAGGNAPLISTLHPGAKVTVTGEAMNDKTKWYSIDVPGDADGWVAAAFVKIA